MKKTVFKNFIEQFKFQELFLELGWNHLNSEERPVRVDDENLFYIKPVSEKEGLYILIANQNENGIIPTYSVRKKLESRVTKLFGEHLIIFVNENKTEQLWQWRVRKPNQPDRLSDTKWIKGQSPELLYQKASGLLFSLDEEDEITIVDVRERVAKNFDKNNEKVTKNFYTSFKKEHTNFLKFIEGIEKRTDQEWYTSLMLNRLMFCYFIQKKGFLNGDKDYLRGKLNACKKKKGENEFYNFYRDFLLALFHEGLGAPVQSKATEIELGSIPYLNGGLFDEHDLERSYDIHIEDEAFESIFDFFDKWEWHLDTSHGATGKEINPDVIGYIFEKYINDRADMGAYYTKEDITDYISKNCILPYLFDETERHYSHSFAPNEWVWTLLKESGDKYIYDAVKHGIPVEDESFVWKQTANWWENSVFGDLPVEIKSGLNPNQEELVDIRQTWNTSAPEEVALPTEIWREIVERRKRYVEVRQKIENGELTRINDLITYNLNIRQFVQDVLQNSDDPSFILHFYKSMAGDGKTRNPISILDPTCGSGAFLFAALNILEPLYETCLLRMRSWIEEEDLLNNEDKEQFRHKYKFFREVLEDVQNEYHPNQEYYIYKSIVLRNLYGVDIMREAVEIAKLRLFLKMVATVEVDTSKKNLGLEPLPDIDFNIRAGNTLVGIGTEEDIKRIYVEYMDIAETKEEIDEHCEIVAGAFKHYKKIQLSYGEDFESFKEAKKDLAERLSDLRAKLDDMVKRRYYPGKELQEWKETHQPFHWYAEFYDIIQGRGGFDVIIGNPPYVRVTKKIKYEVNDFTTYRTKNLFAYCIERSLNLANSKSYHSMIVPISMIGKQSYDSVINFLTSRNDLHLANFSGDTHPGTLFNGVQQNLCIYIARKNASDSIKKLHTTKFLRFYDGELERDYLFHTKIIFSESILDGNKPLQIGSNTHYSIIQKMRAKSQLGLSISSLNNSKVYYHDVIHYWMKAFTSPPYFKREGEKQSVSSHYKSIKIPKDKEKTVQGFLLSSLFYVWYVTRSNGRDVASSDVLTFPCDINDIEPDIENRIISKVSVVNQKIDSTKKRVIYSKKSGIVEYDQYWVSGCAQEIRELDKVLANYYSLSNNELDYLINFDVKYRLGSELEDE